MRQPLLQPDLGGPGAPFRHLEVALHPFAANFIRMRSVATTRQHHVLLVRVVELRVIGERTVAPTAAALAASFRWESM